MKEKKLSVSDIATAEKLLGIEYSDAERELMVDNIGALIIAAQAQRDVTFPNTLPPATTFDPRLSTTVMPLAQKPLVFGSAWAPAIH